MCLTKLFLILQVTEDRDLELYHWLHKKSKTEGFSHLGHCSTFCGGEATLCSEFGSTLCSRQQTTRIMGVKLLQKMGKWLAVSIICHKIQDPMGLVDMANDGRRARESCATQTLIAWPATTCMVLPQQATAWSAATSLTCHCRKITLLPQTTYVPSPTLHQV